MFRQPPAFIVGGTLQPALAIMFIIIYVNVLPECSLIINRQSGTMMRK